MIEERDLPLAGVRVLDLTHRLAGPTMTMFLADWGADVIKIEWWHRMDAWRGLIDVDHDTDGEQRYEKAPNWLKMNRNKRDITLNLKTEKGKGLFLEFVKKADMVTENFSALVMERLGLGYETLARVNPRIIMVSLPGFGNSGPHASYVSNGSTIEGYAGLVSLTGYEDGVPRSTMGVWPDPVAGISGAVALGMALFQRETSGRGQYIELPQGEALIRLFGEAVLDYSVSGRAQRPIGNSDQAMAPHGCYPCLGEDAWVTIAVSTDQEWRALCRVANHPEWKEDARFADQVTRRRNRDALDQVLAAWSKEEERWDLSRRLQSAGVAATPVARNDDFEEVPDFPSVGFYQYIEHPYLERYPGAAAHLDGESLPVRRPPPRLGQHNREVYTEFLGLSEGEIGQLQEEGVV